MIEIADLEKIILGWMDEKSIPHKHFTGIEIKCMSDHKTCWVLGRCTWFTNNTFKIYLDEKTLGLPKKCLDAVMWHEFCHAWDYWENRGMDSHGKRFYSYFLTRKWVCGWDLVAKILFLFNT